MAKKKVEKAEQSKIENVGKAIRAEVCGERRVLLYNLRVMRDVSRRYEQSEQDGREGVSDNIDDIIYTVHQMMTAGCKYAKANNIPCPDAVPEEYMLDVCTADELDDMTAIIKVAMAAGRKTDIKTMESTGDEKNGEAMPEK